MRAASAMTGGIVAAGLMLAPATIATAEPIAPGGAYATIGQLEASGYDVNIDRVGSAPLDQCIVTSVRNPQDITRTDPGGQRPQGRQEGLRLRRNRGAPDDHRLAQLRRSHLSGRFVRLFRLLPSAAWASGGLGRWPVNTSTIRFSGPSPLGGRRQRTQSAHADVWLRPRFVGSLLVAASLSF